MAKHVSLVLLMLWLALPATAAQIRLSLDAIRHDAFSAEGIVLAVDAAKLGEADIRIARLRFGDSDYRELRLHCSGFSFDGRNLSCPQGTLRRDDERGRDRPPLPFSFGYRSGDKHFEFALRDVDVVELSPLVKRLRGWRPGGRIDFRIAFDDGRATLDLGLHGVGFAAKDGSVKARDLEAKLAAVARRKGADWEWQADFDWQQGELARAPWRREGGVRMAAAGVFSAAQLDVRQARLEVDGFGAVDARFTYDRAAEAMTAWNFATGRLDLATAMNEWVQPWLDTLGFPAWQTAGQARFAADWSDGLLRSFYAGLENAGVADHTGYIDLKGVTARIPWRRGEASEAEIAVAGGRLGELPLGGFVFPMHIEGETATVRKLAAPMLDGRFGIDELRVQRDGDGWDVAFAGDIDGVSMAKLSQAMNLPPMEGSLTARIPRISYDDGVLALDGALGINVFGGGITVHRLRVRDPFGKGRHMVVDVTARNLDLGMLTRTFAFGSVEGRFDADLRDLEMDGWRPLRFQARIESSPGEYPRLLSYGALRDIAALGESGEGAVLSKVQQRTGGFGYSRIGMTATLADGVCRLDGIAADGDGFVLMEGSGFPAVRIIGYNRRLHWDALVARVREMLAGKTGVVVQ